MNLEIRPAHEAEAETIADIFMRSKQASTPHLLIPQDKDRTFQITRWLTYIQRGSQAQGSKGDGTVLLAIRNEVPVGFLAFHHTTRHGAEAELQAMYVLQEFQAQRIGTQLLHHLLDLLSKEATQSA